MTIEHSKLLTSTIRELSRKADMLNAEWLAGHVQNAEMLNQEMWALAGDAQQTFSEAREESRV